MKGTLNIFDLDDTLFVSSARIRVIKDGEFVARVTTAEIKMYKDKPGIVFDMSEYESSKRFYDTATPIEKMLRRAELVVKHQGRNSATIIITARSDLDDKDLFIEKFRMHNFPIDRIYVERSGNIGDGTLASDVTKPIVIKRYIDHNQFSKVRMWDDHEPNLKALLRMRESYPQIEFEPYIVDPQTGVPKRYSG